MSRQRLSVEARREQLLEAGKRIFAVRAFDAISTDDLAQEAGISKGLLYHYFKNKRGYYVAVVRRLADEFLEATRIDPGSPLDDAMPAAIGGFYAFLGDHGSMYRALVRGGIGSDAETGNELERVRQALVERLIVNLDLENPSSEQRARLYGWVGCAEAVGLHQVQHGGLDREAFTALLIQALTGLWAPVMLD